MQSIFLITLLVAATVALSPIYFAHPDHRIEGSYIVVYNPNVDQSIIDGHKTSLKSLDATNFLKYEYDALPNVRGYAGNFSRKSIEFLRQSSDVAYIEEDQMMYASACVSAGSVPSWGLNRVRHRANPGNSNYQFNDQGGAGVTAYIVDTGILLTHNDFQGRAVFGFKAESGWSNGDGNGHGTHVAGTVGGGTYGVAKKVTLSAVKVLSDSGSGSTSGVVAGVNYVAQQKRNNPNNKMVANMSLGGGASTALDNSVNDCYTQGVLVVVAAGNDGLNACNYSPARAKDALTIGATTSADARSSFSNIGSCVDIFCPGSNIAGPWIGSNTATNTISGTSMASPHVCGIAALHLAGNAYTPARLKEVIKSIGSQGYLSGIGTGSPNLLCYTPACE